MIERWRRTSVVVGAGGWLVASFDAGIGDIERLLLLAPLVLVPLLLGVLAAAAEPDGRLAAHLPEGVPAPQSDDGLERAIALAGRGTVVACVPAALLTVLAVQARPGGLAAAASLPWLVFAVLLAGRAALAAVRRVRVNRHRTPAAFGAFVVDLSALFALVGAGWLTLWTAGVRPLGFGDVTVLLTAVHFHHAGLVLTGVAGLVALRRPGRASTIGAGGVVIGIPLVAGGIVVGSPWDWWAALLLALAAFVVAGLLAAEARQRTDERASWRMLQAGSALGLTVGMGFVVVYAASHLAGSPQLDTVAMATWHGTANAFVFGLFGALAWSDTRTDP